MTTIYIFKKTIIVLISIMIVVFITFITLRDGLYNVQANNKSTAYFEPKTVLENESQNKVESNGTLKQYSITTNNFDNTMKYNKDFSKKLLNKFLKSKINSKERRDIYFSLSASGAGWVLFKEISDLIYQGNIDDGMTSDLMEILADAYEGGSFEDNAKENPKNEKDQVIQDLLREQLNHPAGKKSLSVAMGLLFILEGGDQTNILEDSLQKNTHLLTENEKLEYRLHYGLANFDRLVKVIEKIPKSNHSSFFKTVSVSFHEQVLFNENSIKNHPHLRKTLRSYLDENIVSFDDYENLSYEEQYSLSKSYANWLLMYGATEGEENLSNYLYQTSVDEQDPRKLLSIIDFQLENIELTDDSTEYDRLMNDPAIKTTLHRSLSGNQIDDDEKKRLKILLGIQPYEEPTASKIIETSEEFAAVVSSMSKENKEKLQAKLLELSEGNKLSQEKKSQLKEFLENNF